MSRGKQLAKNTLIIGMGRFSTQFVAFLLLPIYTKYLSPAEYGTVDIIISYLILLVPLLTLQIEMAAFRFLIDSRQDEDGIRSIVSNSTVSASFSIFSVLILSIPVNIWILPIPYYWYIFGAISSMALSNISLQIARGLGRNIDYAIGSIVAAIVTLTASSLLVAVFGLGARGILLGLILSNTSTFSILFWRLNLGRRIKPKSLDLKVWKELAGYAIPLIPNALSWWLTSAAGRTIIVVFLSSSANGIFAVSSKFPAILSGIFSVFFLSWTESTSLHVNDHDGEEFLSRTMNTVFRFFAGLGLLLIGIVPAVFPALIDDSYHEALYYIPILTIAAVLNALVSLYSGLFVAKKMTKQVASTSITAALISVSLSLIFVHYFQLYAMATATLIAFLAMAIFRAYSIQRVLKVTMSFTVISEVLLAYSICIAGYYSVLDRSIAVRILVFICALAFFTIINRQVLKNPRRLVGFRRS